MSTAPAVVWLDRDLRLADNPSLSQAAATGRPIVPVFVWSPEEEAPWAPGAASRWWLSQSLASLDSAFAERGSRLILRRGPAADALAALAAETGAHCVFWNRRYEPSAVARDRVVESELARREIRSAVSPGNVLFEPGTVLNRSGRPFQVFTPFWRACLALPPPRRPEPPPPQLLAPTQWPTSLSLSDLFDGRTCVSPTFALGGHFLSACERIPFAFNVGTAKIGENRLGEDLASFLRCPSLACCC